MRYLNRLGLKQDSQSDWNIKTCTCAAWLKNGSAMVQLLFVS